MAAAGKILDFGLTPGIRPLCCGSCFLILLLPAFLKQADNFLIAHLGKIFVKLANSRKIIRGKQADNIIYLLSQTGYNFRRRNRYGNNNLLWITFLNKINSRAHGIAGSNAIVY